MVGYKFVTVMIRVYPDVSWPSVLNREIVTVLLDHDFVAFAKDGSLLVGDP